MAIETQIVQTVMEWLDYGKIRRQDVATLYLHPKSWQELFKGLMKRKATKEEMREPMNYSVSVLRFPVYPARGVPEGEVHLGIRSRTWIPGGTAAFLPSKDSPAPSDP